MIKNDRSKINARNRIDIPALIAILQHLARNSGVARPELMELTGLSRAGIARLFADIENALGVRITWRSDGTMPSRGEYHINDWGLLNQEKVMTYTNTNS